MTRTQRLGRLYGPLRILLVVLAVLTITSSVAFAEGEDEYYLTWEEYITANEIESWNWNDAADAIEIIANHAIELYEAGDQETAYEYAKATYWGYYETTGFERNTMTYISGARVSAVELQFTNFRKSIKKDLGAETVRAEGEGLIRSLHEDALILSPEGSSIDVSAGASSGGAVATFIGSLAIIVREGLEAILIVGAIIAYLVKSGNKKGVVPVYVGSVFAIICSFVMAALLNYLKAINPETTMSQEVIEGVAALLAVAVLFYVSNWMVSKSESAAWTSYIKGKAEGGVTRGSMFTLGFTAWLAVFREGAEVILFYQPMLNEEHKNMVWLGFGVGCVILVIVFIAMRVFSVRLPLKPFFMVMSILMAVMCVCFLGAGIKELMEGGVFDGMPFMFAAPGPIAAIPYNDVLDVFGIYPLAGTIIPQIILAVILVITFLVATRRNAKIRAQAEAEKAAGGEA